MKLSTRARDKPVFDYRQSHCQMGDLLIENGDPISKLSPQKKKRLIKRLERYMSCMRADKALTLDMGISYLRIKGADEAGYLYNILI